MTQNIVGVSSLKDEVQYKSSQRSARGYCLCDCRYMVVLVPKVSHDDP